MVQILTSVWALITEAWGSAPRGIGAELFLVIGHINSTAQTPSVLIRSIWIPGRCSAFPSSLSDAPGWVAA